MMGIPKPSSWAKADSSNWKAKLHSHRPFSSHRGGGGRGDGGPKPFTPETVIERNPLPDGSIAIKASTPTPQWNGHCDVKVEHFVVPTSNAALVGYYSHTGSPVPIPDYLTRAEYHVAPPDSELEDPPRPSHAYDWDDVNDDNVRSFRNQNVIPLISMHLKMRPH